MHAVNMEGMEAAVFCLLAEHFQSGILRCCSEREEGQIFVLAVSDQLADELVLRVNLIFCNAFDFCVLLQYLTDISKRGLQLLCAAASLGGVCLITDDGEVSAVGFIHFLENDWELLQSGNNDTHTVVQCLLQILGVLAFTDGFYGAKGMVESGNGCLQLRVQNGTVGDNDNAAENGFIVLVMKRCQTICRPRNGVGLAGSCGVLDQIIASGSVCFDVGNEFAHDVELVETRENEFVALQTDELLDDVHHAVCLKYILPKVIGGVTVRVCRVTLTAIVSGSVAALIERQEVGLVSGKLRGHPRFAQIHAEECEDALIELEADLTRITVCFPLSLRVLHALAGELVLQLEGKYRDAVHGKDHIHGILIVCAVMPLADAVEDVLLIVFHVRLVEAGLRHEVAYTE